MVYVHLKNFLARISLTTGIAIFTTILVFIPVTIIALNFMGYIPGSRSCQLTLVNGVSPCYLGYITWLVLSVAVTLITGILALADVKTQTSFLAPIIGGTFLITALYDLYSLLTEIGLKQPVAEDYFYMRWFISRSLLTFLMITSVAYHTIRQHQTATKSAVSQLLSLYVVTLGLVVSFSPVFDTITFISGTGSIISSPYELAILVLQGLIAILLWNHRTREKTNTFEKTVLLSFIPAMLAQVSMSLHKVPFDIYFNSACYLRLVSFVLPFIGLCMKHINASLKRKKIIRRLHQEISARTLAQRSLEDREKQLALTQLHLKQKIEALNESNVNLEKFAYTASHDLQEPLRKIRAFGDLLRKNYTPNLDNKGVDYIDRMNNAASRMQAMIDSLLSFSQSKSIKTEFVSVSLKSIIEDVLADLEYLIQKKKAVIHFEANVKLPAIPSQLHHLILNLLSNALKFQVDDNTPKINIRAFFSSEDHPLPEINTLESDSPYCILKISDNGIGFDNEDAGRIFDLFYRLHSRTEYEGSGIGLSIVKKIADNHKAVIEAEGIVGKGATFTVYLPI